MLDFGHQWPTLDFGQKRPFLVFWTLAADFGFGY